MKKHFIILLVCLSNFIYAQNKPSSLDFKIGVGNAMLGTGDYHLMRFESELTKKWNRWLSNSFAVNVGIGYRSAPYFRQANSLHADLNVFVSPFGNHRRNNLKIGTGLTTMQANVSYMNGRRIVYNEQTKELTEVEYYGTETRRTTGFSMIIEDELSIGEKYLIGLKLLMQPYSNADILVGFNFKLGIKL